MASENSSLLYSVVWLLTLIFLVWPLAYFCFSWWVFLMPFESLLVVLFKTEIVYDVNAFLERLVTWPRLFGQAILEGWTSFPSPPSLSDTTSTTSRAVDFHLEPAALVYTVLWLLLFFFVSWPVAYFVGVWWIFLLPFESVLEALKDVNGFLEKFVTWPRLTAKATLSQYREIPHPFLKDDASSSGYQGMA